MSKNKNPGAADTARGAGMMGFVERAEHTAVFYTSQGKKPLYLTASHTRLLARKGITWSPLFKVADVLLVTNEYRKAFTKNGVRKTVFIAGDDCEHAYGPKGFDERSLRLLLSNCAFCSIVACAPLSEAYEWLAKNVAGKGQDGAIIETRPEYDLEWMRLVEDVAPNAEVLLATVQPEGPAS